MLKSGNDNFMRNLYRKIFSLLILTILCCTVLTPVSEAIKDVRVGYIDYPGFIELDGSTFKGYGVEYLDEVERHSDLHFIYVHDTWSNCLAKILSGEIDMVCTAQPTPERVLVYDFSKNPIGTESTVIYARPDDEKVAYEEFAAFNGRKIGMLDGSFQNEIYPAYAKAHNFTCTPIYFSNESDMMSALSHGTVDLALGGSLAKHPAYKIVGEFGSDPFYFMMKKNNIELLDALNKVLDIIDVKKPYFAVDLYNKWYGSNVGSGLPNFTREELNFIKSAPAFTVAFMPVSPMACYEEKTKRMEGITPDILRLISKKSGLKFNFAFSPEGRWPGEDLLQGKYDLVAGFKRNGLNANNNKMELSNPYLTTQLVGLVRRGEVVNSQEKIRVGYLGGVLGVAQILKDRYPKGEILDFHDPEEGGKALIDKHTDVFVLNRFVANRLVQNPRFNTLTIYPEFALPDYQCLGAAVGKVDPKLITIINKSIDTIGDQEMNNIIITHTVANPYQPTLGDFTYQYRYPLILVNILLLTCLGMFYYSARIKAKAYEEIAASNNHLKEVASVANRANEAKTQFLSSMSHDIRTPLNAIIGLTTLANDEYGHKEKGLKEYFDKVFVASKTLLGIVNNVLDMSAIENEKMKINLEEFNLRELLDSIVSVYAGECERRKIIFTTDFSGIMETAVIGDPSKINRIIDNIVSNAYKFTEEGGSITFTATEKVHDADHILLLFTVQDTGRGMSESMQKRLFKPFEQEMDSRLTSNGGAGLGMSITKTLVTMMQGDISFTSKLQQGTTFKVNLLLHRVREEAKVEGAPQAPKKLAPSQYDFKGKRLLLAEDNLINAEIAKKLLNKVGFVIEEARDGQEAVDMFRAHQGTDYYAGILMDIQMPRLNGLVAAKTIRKIEKNSHIPILAMTANAFADDIAATSAAGMDAHIAKPLDRDSMYATLAKFFS